MSQPIKAKLPRRKSDVKWLAKRQREMEGSQLALKQQGLELWGKVAAHYEEGVWLSSLLPQAPTDFARHSLDNPRFLAQVEHKVVLALYGSLEEVMDDIDSVLNRVKAETIRVSDAAEDLRLVAHQTYHRLRFGGPPPPPQPPVKKPKLEPPPSPSPALLSKLQNVAAPPPVLPLQSSSSSLHLNTTSRSQSDALRIFSQQLEIDSLKAEIAELKAAKEVEDAVRKRKREEALEEQGDGLGALDELWELVKNVGKPSESVDGGAEVGAPSGEPMEVVVEQDEPVEAEEEVKSSRPNIISRSLSPQKPSHIASSPPARRAVSFAPPVTPSVSVASWSQPPTSSSPWTASPEESQKARRLEWSEIKDQRLGTAEKVG